MATDGATDMTQQGLDARELTVHYATPGKRGSGGRVLAVDRASLRVGAGEVVALTGPSGCGKSTLLRAVAGLEPLSHGSVSWDGTDLARTPPHRRGFGLMFQDGQLFGHLSVAGNIAYGLRAKRVPAPQREARVSELLELVGLPGFASRGVHELSGGQRQRVALARSLAPEPRLLLLDEPLSALDRGLRERLAGELSQLLRQTGTSAILVTHDESEAEMIADRTIGMSGGRLLE